MQTIRSMRVSPNYISHWEGFTIWLESNSALEHYSLVNTVMPLSFDRNDHQAMIDSLIAAYNKYVIEPAAHNLS